MTIKKIGLLLSVVLGLGFLVQRISIAAEKAARVAALQQGTLMAAAQLAEAVESAVAKALEAQKREAEAKVHSNAGKVAAKRASERVIVPTDSSALTEAIAMAEDWHEAYEEEVVASGLLRQANDSLRAALSTIVPSAGRLSDVAVRLVEATRPSFLERVIPKVGVGVAAGINPATMKPAVVVGVTLGWNR